MRKIKQYARHAILILCFGLFIFVFAGLCFAGPNSEFNVIAPEPGSIALVSVGIMGWVVKFVRKKFHQFKRRFDVVSSIIGIVVLTPIVALVGIIIKIASPNGPIFFKQNRTGLDGKEFYMFKLRTMNPDAEKNTGPVWAEEEDPRLIRLGNIKLGRILRKLHFDEFPQLINVLKGEMSIIGPRPERPVFVESLSKDVGEYKNRLRIKPGITGLAQVRHKYDETIQDVKKKVKLDLLYIRRMCFLVDLRILLRTCVVAVTGKGAR